MKKLFVLTSLLLLAGCACFDEQPEKNDGEYHTVQDLYRSGKTCSAGDCGREEPRYQETRRVRKIYRQPAESYTYIERPVYQPRRVPVYNQPVYMQPAPAPVAVPAPAQVPCYNAPAAQTSGCQPTVSETREPVEVVYKKTTYRTTYQPQTTSSVSYEKVPYTAQSDVVVPAAQPAPAPVPAPVAAPQPQPQPAPAPVYVPAPQPQPAYVPAPVVREVVVPADEYVTETVEISPEEIK